MVTSFWSAKPVKHFYHCTSFLTRILLIGRILGCPAHLLSLQKCQISKCTYIPRILYCILFCVPVVDIISALFEQLVFAQLQEFRGTIKAKTSLFIKKKYRAQGNRMYRQTSTSLPSRDKLVKLKVPYCFVNADFIKYLRTPVCCHRVMIFNDSMIYVFFVFYTAILTDSIANYRCPSYPLSRPYLTIQVSVSQWRTQGRFRRCFSRRWRGWKWILAQSAAREQWKQGSTKRSSQEGPHTGPWGGGSRQFHKSRQSKTMAGYSSGHRTGGNIGAKATQEPEPADQLPTVQPRQD